MSFSVSSHVSVNVLSCTQRTLWSTHQRLYQSSVFILPAENCFLCLVWWWFIRTQWKGAHQHQATAWLEVRTSFKIFRWCWKQTCAVHAPWCFGFHSIKILFHHNNNKYHDVEPADTCVMCFLEKCSSAWYSLHALTTDSFSVLHYRHMQV